MCGLGYLVCEWKYVLCIGYIDVVIFCSDCVGEFVECYVGDCNWVYYVIGCGG